MAGTPDGIADAAPPWLRRAPDRRGRIGGVLRCVVFLLVAAILVVLALLLLRFALHVDPAVDAFPSIGMLLSAQLLLVSTTVLVPTALMLAVTRDGPTAFGWNTGDRGRDLAIGLASGAAAMALLIALVAAGGGATIHPAVASPGSAIRHGLGYAGVFALVAVGEEGLLRGYPLLALSRAIGFWPAAGLSSLLFALLHAPHGGETAAGLADVALTGLLLCFSLRRSGGLWFALGWHAAWDFAETFVFGTPDSGVPARDPLLLTTLHGPAWLTGGGAGPEGSLLVLPVLAFTALLVRLALRNPARR